MATGLMPQDIAALKQEILSSMHCALPGIVQSYNAGQGTANISLAVRRKKGDSIVSMPFLQDVPVYLPDESRTIYPGEFALVIFADCDLETFLETGQASLPASGRQHSLSDAFAFVGFRAGQ